MTPSPAQLRADALAAQARRIHQELRSQGPRPQRRRAADSRCIAVQCLETGERFDSQALAADWLGVGGDRISDAVEYGRRVRGFRFQRLAEGGAS